MKACKTCKHWLKEQNVPAARLAKAGQWGECIFHAFDKSKNMEIEFSEEPWERGEMSFSTKDCFCCSDYKKTQLTDATEHQSIIDTMKKMWGDLLDEF